jgi:hypothetical protein
MYGFISYARKPQAFKPRDEWYPFEAKRTQIGVRSILLALSFRVKKVKKYVAYYLPVAERILCLISGFSRKNHFPPL